MLCITKLKALHIKFLSNPSVSSRVLTIWKYDGFLQRFQLSWIFRDCTEIKHHVPKSQNTINLFQIKAFSSTFKENPKFLLFHSPKLFIYKLTSSSTASSTIFKYFKSQRWCLLKNSSSSVLDTLIPTPYYSFKNRNWAKILLYAKTDSNTRQKNLKRAG